MNYTKQCSNAVMNPKSKKQKQAEENSKISQLRNLISQSYKIFNTYGKSENDISEALKVFYGFLKPYSEFEITIAFRIWMQEQKNLPTPSDIISTIKASRGLPEYVPPTGRTHFPSDDEIASVEKMVQNLRASHDEQDAKIGSDKNKPNYAHFNRMAPELQQECINNLKKPITKHG